LVSGFWWACSAAIVACDSCDDAPDAAKVGRVVLNLPRAFDQDDEARRAIRTAIAERLADAETVTFVSSDRKADHVLHLTAGPVVSGAESEEPGRPVELRLRPRGEGHEYRAVGRGLPLAELDASVMTGFDDAWRVIEMQRWLDISADPRMIDSLNHPDPRMREFVIQRLGERQVGAAVEPLCDRLTAEPRPELVLRAVGALVAIGDERAVEPLIELTRRKDPRFVVQVVFALGAIGGRTAQGYLVTLASGHPVEAVRTSAAQALEELAGQSADRGRGGGEP
jgi:hypothetical protein